MKNNILCGILICLIGCSEFHLPKPKAQLRLDYPKAVYQGFQHNCGFSFDYNSLAKITFSKNCNLNLDYPKLKANIFLTYKKVNDNLKELIMDAEKLTFDHSNKANNFIANPFVNKDNQTYGIFYEIEGNAASQAQFYITDSIRHFITASLYFRSKPNYDSILPAAAYIKKDMRVFMESIHWEK